MGIMKEGPVQVNEGDLVKVTNENIEGTKDRFSILLPTLLNDLVKGDLIFINDGIVSLRVLEVQEKDLVCTVETGGQISSKKGCNIPSTRVKVDVLTEKDKRDLKFIAQVLRPDFVAASFVANAEDILSVRKVLKDSDPLGSLVKIVAKIERPVALDNIEDIVMESDGIMVARGDLGVEIPTHEVPVAQKRITRLANIHGKPVIIATQMLDSMTNNKRCTRAEASDVFNAVIDGADALMLSGETSVGKYPAATVKQMRTIAAKASEYLERRNPDLFDTSSPQLSETLGHAIYTFSKEFNEISKKGKIVIITESGYTARMVIKYRPQLPVLALTGSKRVNRELCLLWGVKSVYDPKYLKLCKSQKYEYLIKTLVSNGLLDHDDISVLVHATDQGSTLTVYDIKKLLNNTAHEQMLE